MDQLRAHMVQYSVWPNCCNNCEFCLRTDRRILTKQQQIDSIRAIRKNLDYVDWAEKFSAGISLLGGELYYVTDSEIQDEFMKLIDDIIEKVIKSSSSADCRYSTVTNGLYDPAFLYRVVDRFVETVGISHVDVNFSYDLKYRYKSAQDAIVVLRNINSFHDRYVYNVGVQMILTQYLIDMHNSGEFDILKFINEDIPGNNFCFLYPHKVNTGKKLYDFNFKRDDFIRFMTELRSIAFKQYTSFVYSTLNSAKFKYSGSYHYMETGDFTEQPILTELKDIIDERCGHSVLYRCYSDSDRCMLCDLKAFDADNLL